MGICLVALLAFGGTYAYFTATTGAVGTGTIKTGTVLLSSTAVDLTANNVVPGDTINKALKVTDNSTVDTWIIAQVKTTGTGNLYSKLTFVGNEFGTALTTTGTEANAVYYGVAGTGAEDNTNELDFCTSITVDTNWNAESTNGSAHTDMGQTVTITITFKSIQKSAAASAAEAAALLFKAA